MQTLDNAIRLRPKRRLLGRGVKLQTEQDPEKPNPTYIPAADHVARWMAERTGGIPQSGLNEAIFNIPTTAHILGGAAIGEDPQHGVVDGRNRVFGYENLRGLRRSGHPRESRGQPQPDDHRARRARDGAGSGEGWRERGIWPSGGDARRRRVPSRLRASSRGSQEPLPRD